MMTYDYPHTARDATSRKSGTESDQVRIGLVGTQSDHAADFLRMINAGDSGRGARFGAVWGEEAEHTTELASRYPGLAVAASPDSFAGEVDAAVIVVRDGNRHRELALPFLQRGLPVFIDKPLACSLADADALLDSAPQSGARLLSASALRWQPDTDAVARRIAELGGATSLVATGTFYPDSEYGGLFYYGIHAAELAVQLAGSAITDMAVERVGVDGVVVRGRAGTTAVAVRLVPPPPSGEISFSVAAQCRDGNLDQRIGLGDDYMAPVVERFVTMIRDGTSPLSRDEMRTPIALLAAADAAFRATR